MLWVWISAAFGPNPSRRCFYLSGHICIPLLLTGQVVTSPVRLPHQPRQPPHLWRHRWNQLTRTPKWPQRLSVWDLPSEHLQVSCSSFSSSGRSNGKKVGRFSIFPPSWSQIRAEDPSAEAWSCRAAGRSAAGAKRLLTGGTQDKTGLGGRSQSTEEKKSAKHTKTINHQSAD